ncbi:MAG: GDP-mannose 4,6-dehydratase, partial [Candidatus Thermoplasmatota archaeon]|nr:GDP-mannose 4,6-dehydratase [Candidatus Thermoplasmatota archaeon]
IFIEALKNDEQISIHGNGLQTRCYTHVEDIASGIIAVMDSNKNGIYNISSDEEMNVIELIELIAGLMGKTADTVHVEDRFGQINKSKISSEKLQHLGWKAKYDLKSGLKTCI